MRRLGSIWDQVISFENLLLSYRKARLGKKSRNEVANFSLNLEQNLLALQQSLLEGSYQPGAYRLFTIYERKPRLISAAPFIDRIVQHAIMNLLEPALDKTFIFDSYACRRGKGVHAAVERYQHWSKRYYYVLKIDIEKYFASIDQQILKEKLRKRVKDKNLLALLDVIIDTGPAQQSPMVWYPDDDLLTPLYRTKGIPIGNLTSQFFANLYLDDFDHFVKEQLRMKAYLRYVDDMVLLADNKVLLTDVKAKIDERLALDRIRLHPNKVQISCCKDGLNLLGYMVYPGYRRLRPDNGHRFARRLKKYARLYSEGKINMSDIQSSVASWIGHACHADTEGLRRAIFWRTVFKRGMGQ